MDAKKYYEMADLALCEKTAYSQSVAAAAAQISIAISLHRIAESLDLLVTGEQYIHVVSETDTEAGGPS